MRRPVLIALALIALAGVVSGLVLTGVTGDSFLHIMGVKPRAPSTAYNFWSGFGSDITEVLILGGLVTAYRKHNCGVKGCWRLGMRPVPGTHHVVCHRHHPLPRPTVEQVHEDYRRANGS